MKLDQLQVLIPYKDLAALLEIAQQFGALEKDVKQLRKELDAVRCRFTELNEKCLEIERAL